jgi:alpha-glucosidase (family GH31 glycosyl hydrolase)
LFEASQFGTTCFDPLFFHYADDDLAYNEIEHSFIFANALKISPILTQGIENGKEFPSYFPKTSG